MFQAAMPNHCEAADARHFNTPKGPCPEGSATWPITPGKGDHKATPADVYEAYVLTTAKLKTYLPARTYQELQKQMKSSRILDSHLADVIAHAAKDWALSQGATHFTHVFQPLTGGGAEKQDSFFSFSRQSFDELGKPIPINSFTGSQLLQSEPDASSFPHGGIRSTFEARGYTIWDSASPMYLYPGPLGTMVLCVPSIFISYDGKVLDEKTILLRSEESLNQISVKMLHLLGISNVSSVKSNLGVEQEFFLVNKQHFDARMDLKLTGATLFGKLPPKHQQLEDHYFKRIPEKELAIIAETELTLYKLGVPCKTRHSEVAPKQFEMAPVFESSSIASDHNALAMSVLGNVARKYNTEALFHEKPFKGVNGSGKHCNWSISTDTGLNLLDPGVDPISNIAFLTFLTACLDAVNKHGTLLLASITSSSNRHRLGAAEAPPGVISVFLGSFLTGILEKIKTMSVDELVSTEKEGTGPKLSYVSKSVDHILDIKLSCLPQVPKDLTDRNRTSPFAFTGNKFEFRAVGSKQLPYLPMTLLNAAVSDSLAILYDEMKSEMDKLPNAPGTQPDKVIFKVIRKHILNSERVRFEGNNYSHEWHKEASARGIAVSKSIFVSNYSFLMEEENKKMLIGRSVFTEEELYSRYHVLMEKYGMDIIIECDTLISIINSAVIPELIAQKKDLLKIISLVAQQQGPGIDSSYEHKKLKSVSDCIANLGGIVANLEHSSSTISKHLTNFPDMAVAIGTAEHTLKAAEELLASAEEVIPGKNWPVPSYYAMMMS